MGSGGLIPLFPAPGILYLAVGRGDEAQELIHVPDAQPVREELHGRLHPLCQQEIPHGRGHPAPAHPEGSTASLGGSGGAPLGADPKRRREILFLGVLFSAPGSPGEAAADEDPPQRVLLAPHRHGWAHLQIPKGIQAGSALWSLPGHVAKIGALGGGKTGENGLKKMQLSALKGCTPKSSMLERPTLKMKEAKGFIPDF